MTSWRPMSKFKPSSKRDVLVCNSNDYLFIAHYSPEHDCFMDEQGMLHSDITHWRDLPEPPKKLLKRQCEFCGKDFQPTMGNQIYCCTWCRQNGRAEMYKRYKKGKCAVCGKEFQKTTNQAFCSDECKKEFYKIIHVKE